MRSNLIQISYSIDEVTKDQISQLSLQSVGDRYGTQHQPSDCPLVLCPFMSLHVQRRERRLEEWMKVCLNIPALS